MSLFRMRMPNRFENIEAGETLFDQRQGASIKDKTFKISS